MHQEILQIKKKICLQFFSQDTETGYKSADRAEALTGIFIHNLLSSRRISA